MLRFGKRVSEGNPVRSMRWHPLIWSRLYDVEADHKRKVKVNRIAAVAVEWGLTFISTLSHELQERILGIKGAKPLTLEEEEKLRKELNEKLGSLAGKFRFDDRMAFALQKILDADGQLLIHWTECQSNPVRFHQLTQFLSNFELTALDARASKSGNSWGSVVFDCLFKRRANTDQFWREELKEAT